ncbi:hypothetical protein [Pseudomonas sp.]|uniref:hypothetical protein n=1 Tax=Pseudomonas sp. TaxID=306 RepID=UPI001A0A0397|nr:hypothetical protein [Pseudomonas sp.]MBF0675549.1 hypothetical protein [Pseudomonas sp.]
MHTDITAIQRRETVRAAINAATAQFIASGGRIRRIDSTWRAAPTTNQPVSFNNRPPKRARRELEAIEQCVAAHGRAYAAIGLAAPEATRRLRAKWLGQYVITQTRVEQLAALYGYAYREDEE